MKNRIHRDTVRSYFDQRLRYAADALSRVTGEEVEELIASLNGQLETEIDPEDIYTRALVDRDSKQTVERRDSASRRARTRGVQDRNDEPVQGYFELQF